MAHNITERDGMFTVRQAAWHGLGTVLSEYPSRSEAQQIAHPWEPESEPVFRRVVTVEDGQPVERFEEIKASKLIVRNDDLSPLGVVNSTYEPVRNEVMYDIAEAIEAGDPGTVMYETGGSLDGGKKVWLLLRLREPIMVPGDPRVGVIPYYALQNSHDSYGSFRGQGTITRIVCDNTSQMADWDARQRGTEFVFRHTATVGDRIKDAQIALAGWRASLEAWKQMSAVLIDEPISDHAVVLFVENYIPMPKTHTVSDRVVHNVETARGQLMGILNGETCEGIRNTSYGLVQAAIEYVNHERRANSQESRFKRAYLDRSAVTADAVKIARELVGV